MSKSFPVRPDMLKQCARCSSSQIVWQRSWSTGRAYPVDVHVASDGTMFAYRSGFHSNTCPGTTGKKTTPAPVQTPVPVAVPADRITLTPPTPAPKDTMPGLATEVLESMGHDMVEAVIAANKEHLVSCLSRLFAAPDAAPVAPKLVDSPAVDGGYHVQFKEPVAPKPVAPKPATPAKMTIKGAGPMGRYECQNPECTHTHKHTLAVIERGKCQLCKGCKRIMVFIGKVSD